MKIKLLLSVLLLLSVGFGTAFAAQNESVLDLLTEEKKNEMFNPSVDRKDFPGAEYIYQGNTHLKEKLKLEYTFDAKAIEQLKQKNAELKFHD
jgi:hypothetical protein